MIWHVSLKIPPRGIRIGFWIKVESQVRHDTPRDSCTLLFCRLNAFLYLMICQMFHAHQNPVMFSINDRNTEGNEWMPCNFVLPTARCLKPSTSMENFWHRRGSRCWKKCEGYRREKEIGWSALVRTEICFTFALSVIKFYVLSMSKNYHSMHGKASR